MVWEQIEPTPAHSSYLFLAAFLILYCLFSQFIRNRLHLSEPPVALIIGIILGPRGLASSNPNSCSGHGCKDDIGPGLSNVAGWEWGDDVVQEATRVISGIQVFAIGVESPKFYASRHWKSVALPGPVMTVGWLISSAFAYFIFHTSIPEASIIGACLTPTDPVLASSILTNSQFSTRIPKRLRDMLSAESGCNDGVSFPFLYIGSYALNHATAKDAVKDYFLLTILWQCMFGIVIGSVIGWGMNRILRFSETRGYIDPASFLVFYLLQALLCVGVGSTLGLDDFSVAFSAGYGFARDGWFSKKTHETHLPGVVDSSLNSAMFVYLGAIIPWKSFQPQDPTPWIDPGRLFAFIISVSSLRRIPIMSVMYKWIPDIRTVKEALFCGHFGPMGLGALFSAIEARAESETNSSLPLPHPPFVEPPSNDRERAIETVWPVVCAVVVASTSVHGLSVSVLSVGSHFSRKEGERAPLSAGETDPLSGMEHGDGGGDSEPESGSEEE